MPIDVAAYNNRRSALAAVRAAAVLPLKPRPDPFERDVHCLLGLPLDALDMAEAVARVRHAARLRQRCFVSTPNVNYLVAAAADQRFRDSVIAADLVLADGMPLVWIARLLGIPLPGRVAGSDLFEELSAPNGRPLPVYFFGGRPGAAARAARRLNATRSGLVCAGFDYPGGGAAEELSGAERIARINASGADFLVVALGAKKGQAWIERNLPRLNVPVVSHLGAVLNFTAGSVRRAPRWMRLSGLEWLWRIREEPGLGRRYLADGIALLRLCATRVLPYAWHLRRHRPGLQDLIDADLDLHEAGAELVLRLSGAWTHANIDELRPVFSRAALAGRPVRIDLAAVSHVDSAFLGLALVLYGVQKKADLPLVCTGANRGVGLLFKYGCAAFLLSPETAAPAMPVDTEQAIQER